MHKIHPPPAVYNDYNFAQAKEDYRAFCETGNHDLPVFALPWYLDAVCTSDEEWRVILYKENDQIRAVFPFAYKKGKYGFWHICNPWQAPRLGIWIDYRGKTEKPGGREAYENTIVADIVSKLPYYDVFQVSFDARFQNWQQFYRMGFQQTSYYSYVLKNPEDIQSRLSSNLRRKIRILYENYCPDMNVTFDEYWSFFEKSYRQRYLSISYEKVQFLSLYHAAQQHDAVSLIACRDKHGQIFSVECLLYDNRRVYGMFHTYDATTSLSTQPIVTLRAIAFAKERGLEFDFEGSMIPGPAQYYSTFSTLREAYFVIYNYSDKYRLFNGLRESARALKNIIKG